MLQLGEWQTLRQSSKHLSRCHSPCRISNGKPPRAAAPRASNDSPPKHSYHLGSYMSFTKDLRGPHFQLGRQQHRLSGLRVASVAVFNAVSTVLRVYRVVRAPVSRMGRLSGDIFYRSIEASNLTYRGVCAPLPEMDIQGCSSVLQLPFMMHGAPSCTRHHPQH